MADVVTITPAQLTPEAIGHVITFTTEEQELTFDTDLTTYTNTYTGTLRGYAVEQDDQETRYILTLDGRATQIIDQDATLYIYPIVTYK
jgi:hypothetical protein